MVATVLVREKNGAGETATDKTSGTVRFKNADDATVDANDPLIKPSSGQEYSFRKSLRLHISAGTFTSVSNPQVYLDGANSFGTGIKLWYALAASFVQPTVPTESNDPPQFPGVTAMADAFGLTSGSPGDMDGNNAGPFDSTSLPKDIGDYLELVMEVETTASQGTLSAETLTFSYDEV